MVLGTKFVEGCIKEECSKRGNAVWVQAEPESGFGQRESQELPLGGKVNTHSVTRKH